MSMNRNRYRKNEPQVNHERWLISYADFITLLFAFFVVMYSISQVSESKYRILSETFVEAFNRPNDSQSNPDPQQNTAPSNDPIVPLDMGKAASEQATANEQMVIISDQTFDDSTPTVDETRDPIEATKKSDELSQISDLVSEKFSNLIGQGLIQVASNELWLQIELKDSILFPSGSAETSEQAQKIFDDIAAILKNYENPVQVEGFTDNVPISSARYPTNWELSSARASAIVKYLAARGVAPERLSAVGYGEYQPVASNETPEGRAQNRRVAIMIAKRKMDRPKTPL
jgi:chemotaxis protein MotB